MDTLKFEKLSLSTMVRSTRFLKLFFACFIATHMLAVVEGLKLEAINVIFRHGDRTPEPESMYPLDPHYNRNYYPNELGDLTNNGKMREYQLGKSLRNRYNDELNDLYVGSEVYARSSDFDRTKMSLLLVLASLFPPTDLQRWNTKLNWQPIPIKYNPINDDALLQPHRCPRYKVERQRVENSREYKHHLLKFKDLMNELSGFTGLNVTNTNQIYELFHTLTAESFMGLPLPEWTKSYFPKGPIIDATLFEYVTYNYIPILKRLCGGMVLRKMVDDMHAVAKGEKMPKISLYSAHELNVASVLIALKAWNLEIPEYSSAIILELWSDRSEYYVKVVYYKGIPSEFEERNIKGCERLCPLEKFASLLHNLLPVNIEKECKSEDNRR